MEIRKSIEQPFRFLDLAPELRVLIYERLPIKTIYTALKSDEAGVPTVVLDLCLPERAILQVQKETVTREAEPDILKLTKACGPMRILVHHQRLDEIPAALNHFQYVQATDAPLLMEDNHQQICEALPDEGGTIDHVQVQMWARLANFHTNTDIEIGIWVEPGSPVTSLFAYAHQYAADIMDPQYHDGTSTFTAVFDWPGTTTLGDAYDPEDVFADLEREMAVVKDPSALKSKDEWGVNNFGEAFRSAKMNLPRNIGKKNVREPLWLRLCKAIDRYHNTWYN